MRSFVSAKRDLTIDGVVIRQFEVGIVEEVLPHELRVRFVSNADTVIVVNRQDVTLFDPQKTGDQFPKKVCNVCNRLLDVQYFQKNQNGKNNRTVRRPSCRDCREIIDGRDMTPAEKRQMEKIKPHMVIWTCPICKKTTIPGLTSKVVCDHDHITGHPRAWICDSCNTGLGRFKDDASVLSSAIDYLTDN